VGRIVGGGADVGWLWSGRASDAVGFAGRGTGASVEAIPGGLLAKVVVLAVGDALLLAEGGKRNQGAYQSHARRHIEGAPPWRKKSMSTPIGKQVGVGSAEPCKRCRRRPPRDWVTTAGRRPPGEQAGIGSEPCKARSAQQL
jgi:hypothetical protein